MRDIHAEYETAKKRYQEAQEEMTEAALGELRRLVHELFPEAATFELYGQYVESGEVRLEIKKVDGRSVEDFPEGEDGNLPEDVLSETCEQALLYLAGASGEDYLHDHEVDVAEEPLTCVCGDKGYLLDQGYGRADIPVGWTPVQACDSCSLFPGDEEAATAAAAVCSAGRFQYFPGVPDDDEDDVPPGDWAINWVASNWSN